MCLDPLTIAAGAATILGTVLQERGNRKAEKARSAAYNAEMARTGALRDEQSALWNQTAGGFERPIQDISLANLRDKRGAVIDQATVDAGPVDPSAGIEGSAPKVVKDAASGTIVNALADARAEGQRLAKLNAFGDLFFDNQLGLNRSGIQQAQLGDFSRGSAEVLPLELEAANAKGASLRGFGQLLQQGGQLAGVAGAFGGATPSAALYKKPVAFPWSV